MEFGGLSISYNGEIYNYLEIRRELKELVTVLNLRQMRGHLHSYAEWGEKCVNKFIGMFAFAIYDKRSQLFHAEIELAPNHCITLKIMFFIFF